MVVADTQFHARQAAGEGPDRLRGSRAADRSVRGTEARRTSGASRGYLRATAVERPAADDRVLSRRRGRGAGAGRARHRGDLRDAADRDRVPRAGSVPGRAAGRRRPGHHRQPGIGLRPPADRQDTEAGSEGRRDHAAPERWCVRREGGTVDPGTDGDRRAAARPAGQDRAHARAVDAAPRQASCDDGQAHGRRRRRRAPARPAIADRRRRRRLSHDQRQVCAARGMSLVRRVPHTERGRRGQGGLHEQSRTPARCAASAATRRSSRWKA